MALVAGLLSCLKSRPPAPDWVKDEVVSCDWRGKRKTSEHVLPAYEAGMSKLKMDETVGVMVPKYWVP